MSILTRRDSSNLLRMFVYAYKQGVNDACAMEDNNLCSEFVEHHRKGGTFGTLDIGEDISWREWRYCLTCMCRQMRCYTVAANVIDKIDSKNYIWAILPISFDFYLKGISDWLAYPVPQGLAVFNASKKLWTPPKTKTRKVLGRDDVLHFIQEFAFNRMRIERGDPNALSESAYDTFAQAIWTLTRPLPPLTEYDKKKKLLRKYKIQRLTGK